MSIHTRASTNAGPDYCRECTEEAQNWTPWPCPTLRAAGPQQPQEAAAAPAGGEEYQRPPKWLTHPLYDPGAFVPRRFDIGPEKDEPEPLNWWQARAVLVAMAKQDISERSKERPAGADDEVGT